MMGTQMMTMVVVIYVNSPLGTADNPGDSCKHILQIHPDSVDGTYTVDFDGEGGSAPLSVIAT